MMRASRLIRVAAILALVALLLIVWGLFDRGITPVLISLSLGQLLGTLSFVLFLIAVARDVRKKDDET